jgi:hypothetical protein
MGNARKCHVESAVKVFVFFSGRVAQGIEHLPSKQRVAGSIPATPTIPVFRGNLSRWPEKYGYNA